MSGRTIDDTVPRSEAARVSHAKSPSGQRGLAPVVPTAGAVGYRLARARRAIRSRAAKERRANIRTMSTTKTSAINTRDALHPARLAANPWLGIAAVHRLPSTRGAGSQTAQQASELLTHTTYQRTAVRHTECVRIPLWRQKTESHCHGKRTRNKRR